MKKVLLGCLITATVFATGCNDISGVLNVSKKFDAIVKGKTKSIEVGDHKTALDFKKDRVIAKVTTLDGDLKIELSVPNNSQIPSNGNFELKSAQTGQPFDVLGNVVTTQTNSALRSDYESCQYQTYDTICTPQGCTTRPVTRWGSRWIEYYIRSTHQEIQFDMTTAGDAKAKNAHFAGAVNVDEKIVTRQNQCL